MIALDTNILVRYFVQDDPIQCGRVNTLLEKAKKEKKTFYISDVVLTELVWVLESCYDFDRQSIHALLSRASMQERFVFSEGPAVHSAIHFYGESPLDFADLLILFQARTSGAKQLITFDKKLRQFDGRFVIEP